MFKRLMIPASLIALLAAGSCPGPQGNFAEIYTPVCFSDNALALEVVQRDRQAAEAIDLNNRQLPDDPC